MPSGQTLDNERNLGAKPEEFRLEMHIFYHFSRILARRNRLLNQELRRYDLDYPRWRVLAVLSQHPGISMLQLAELAAVDRTSLAHTVRLMAEEALLERTNRSSDRRSIELRLASVGRNKLDLIMPTVMALNAQALAGVPVAKIDALLATLGQIGDNLLP